MVVGGNPSGLDNESDLNMANLTCDVISIKLLYQAISWHSHHDMKFPEILKIKYHNSFENSLKIMDYLYKGIILNRPHSNNKGTRTFILGNMKKKFLEIKEISLEYKELNIIDSNQSFQKETPLCSCMATIFDHKLYYFCEGEVKAFTS